MGLEKNFRTVELDSDLGELGMRVWTEFHSLLDSDYFDLNLAVSRTSNYFAVNYCGKGVVINENNDLYEQFQEIWERN